MRVSILLLGLLFAAPAAYPYYGELTDGLRPRCVAGPGGRNVFFFWDESEKYERRIQARQVKLDCSRWRDAGAWWRRGKWAEVLRWTDAVFGVRLDAETRRALLQVRYGARVIRDEDTAEAWLANHPIADYTLNVNRWLVRSHGMGFSGEVYRAWLESRPENRFIRERYRAAFARARENPRIAEALAARTDDVEVLVSVGMGMDASAPVTSESSDLQRVVVGEVPTYGGPPTRILRNFPREDVWGNVVVLKEQINEVLDSGKDVVVLGLCKGAPEVLAALALATASTLDADGRQSLRPAGRGKVLAFVGMSSLLGGTFFADALTRIPYQRYVGPVLSRYFDGNLREVGTVLNQLQFLTGPEMERFNRRMWLGKLPRDVIYLDAIGITSGKGFRDDDPPYQRKVRDFARQWKVTDAANDTYIEYPKMQLPPGMSDRQYSLVFDAPHTLFDGYFDGHHLNTPARRRALFVALYDTILDL